MHSTQTDVSLFSAGIGAHPQAAKYNSGYWYNPPVPATQKAKADHRTANTENRYMRTEESIEAIPRKQATHDHGKSGRRQCGRRPGYRNTAIRE